MKTNTAKTEKQYSKQEVVSVILIRHAQSQWNRENRFTGWADPALTEAGVAEAQQAGEWLHANGYRFDVAYSSRLQRAIHTLDILLDQPGQQDIPRYQDWRLNERHYGALQGVDKTQAAAQVGEHQVWRWRRGYEDRAEPLLRTEATHPANDALYADVDPRLLPGVENLQQTRARVAAFWQEEIAPRIHNAERVLISAHGNTLRALIMELEQMSVEQVESFEIPTATPIEYRFTREGESLGWRYLDTRGNAAVSA
jgi:2,3-bisphosphoglycerate-dependent phosphoglycerate mutase